MPQTKLAAEATNEEILDFVQMMNIEVKGNWGRPKMIESLKLIGVDLDQEGAQIPIIEKAQPAEPGMSHGSVKMRKTSSGREELHHCIVVSTSEGEGGDRPVYTRVNGVNFGIPRGKPVWVPERYVEALDHAVKDVYSATDNGLSEPRKVHNYPFSLAAAV